MTQRLEIEVDKLKKKILGVGAFVEGALHNAIESLMSIDLELAEKVLKLVDSKSKLVFLPLPTDDPKQRKPDISLAGLKLDWSPVVALEDGLKETIAYFQKRLQA